MTNTKIIFFDIGGVLLSNGWGHESREKAAIEFGFDYSEMDILHDFISTIKLFIKQDQKHKFSTNRSSE